MNFITYDLRRVEQPSIRTMGKGTDNVDLELERLADLLAYLIEKYGDKTIKTDVIRAAGIDIGIYTTDFKNEFISLTDIARYRSIDSRITIHNWLRGRGVVEFLGLWEVLYNPDFKRIEFDAFKENAGTNAFVFSIKDWLAEQQSGKERQYA